MNQLPLIVDLDGTLLKSDMLMESGLAFIRQNPAKILLPFLWLKSGKANLKQNLARVTEIDVTTLPYNDKVLTFIKQERAKGRMVVLATASHKIYADKIADYLQLFDTVFATEGEVNLSAKNKRDLLVQKYGEGGFDYIGNSLDDLPIWQVSHCAYLVNPEQVVEKAARSITNTIITLLSEEKITPRVWCKALRFHQWMKNMLMFIPLLASHQILQIDLAFKGILAFILFGLCASSVYLLNDLLDLEGDRQHSTKCNRMIASGLLPIKQALIACPILLMIAFSTSFLFLPFRFFIALTAYYTVTLAYSFFFKRMMALDIITLASLYTLRIIAGACALNLAPTFWMLAFSMFIFLSLALVKRYTELYEARSSGKNKKTRGRGYYPRDLEILASLGTASGYIAVMILALYIQDSGTILLYRYPKAIWLACPILLYWITRIWILTHRGKMPDDPVIFAIKDRASLMAGLLFGVVFWVAI